MRVKCNLIVIVVVKKTFRYSNVFFYNPLCRNSVIRNIIMESGINAGHVWVEMSFGACDFIILFSLRVTLK